MREEKLKPKKPCGVFVEFSKAEREKNPEYYKGIGFINANKELQAKWKSLDFGTRYNYIHRNAERQALYKQQLAAYEQAKQTGRLLQLSKKKAHQPFLAFQKANYQELKREYSGQSHATIMKTLGDMFKNSEQFFGPEKSG